MNLLSFFFNTVCSSALSFALILKLRILKIVFEIVFAALFICFKRFSLRTDTAVLKDSFHLGSIEEKEESKSSLFSKLAVRGLNI